MSTRWPVGTFSLFLVWFALGCDGSPSGPGSLLVTVEVPSASLGAATLEVVGSGITGFEGMGSTHAYGALVSARQRRHRVVLVDPQGGTLQVAVQMEDVRADPPRITVVAAAGTDDLERSTSDVEVRIDGR